jgi:hypothetical protein
MRGKLPLLRKKESVLRKT